MSSWGVWGYWGIVTGLLSLLALLFACIEMTHRITETEAKTDQGTEQQGSISTGTKHAA